MYVRVYVLIREGENSVSSVSSILTEIYTCKLCV